MRRFSKKTAYTVLGMLLAVAFGALWQVSPEWSRQGGLVTLTGNTPPVLTDAQFVQHTNPNKTIDVVVALKLRDEKALATLLREQQDPTSPQFHQWLTPDQFTKRFAPTQADVNRVVAHMQKNGLQVIEVTPNHLLVHVRGKVGQIEKMFHLGINDYSLGDMIAFSNDRDPSIPADLQDVVLGVIGLNDFAVYHSHLIHGQTMHHGGPPSGYGPAQIATAYNFPNANNSASGSKYSGKGVTIAIATAYTYDRSDVNAYWKLYGVNRTGTITDVDINGTPVQLDGETTLDLEQVGAQAPGADVMMYLGKDPGFTTFALVFNQIVTDNKASVATVSWGLCEKDTGIKEMQAEHILFEQAAAQGISFFAAAGDDGAYDCKGTRRMTVDYPSSDPFVTAVGGTALQINADGSRKSESAWTGAGGGVSVQYEQPYWQVGLVPKNARRNTSDVSLVADPNTGYSIYFEAGWDEAGGTSFASPNWAALTGLAVEANGGQRIGSINVDVNRIGTSADYGKVFYDVTTGNNGNGRGHGYSAGKGWDHPTGWGTPDGTAFANWVKNNNPPAPTNQPTPTNPPAPTPTTASPVKGSMAPFIPQR